MMTVHGELDNLLQQHLQNPFLVLALPAVASTAEMERQGQKLLAMLAAGLAEARGYATPVGPRERTAELVRAAMAELRDPERRLRHEWWARGFEAAAPATSAAAAVAPGFVTSAPPASDGGAR